MTVNHDVVGSSPTGGVCRRSEERLFYLSGVILILFNFSLTVWTRKENINVMRIGNRFPIRKFFPTIKSYRLKKVARDLRQPLINRSLKITCFLSIGFQCDDAFEQRSTKEITALLCFSPTVVSPSR